MRPPDIREHLMELVRSTIRTMTGRPNRVIRVDGDRVLVGTARSHDGGWVEIGEIQAAVDRLYRDGEIEVSVPSVGYCG